ncbi:MAG: glycosyltransferase family 2 protein, partial [Comamonadaceae bacterium]
ILLIDDGSTDGTGTWMREQVPAGERTARRIELDPQGRIVWDESGQGSLVRVRTFFHPRNLGKGAALRTGFAAAMGSVVVVQDADLEYDPGDWQAMHALIVQRGEADVVYGSRFRGRDQGDAGFISFRQSAANRLISTLFGVLYGRRISDVETCYKMFTAEVRDTLDITCPDFGCEIQISAQIVRGGPWRIKEVPIRYRGRTYAQGKKINWRDGVKALGYLALFRWRPLPAAATRRSGP